MKKWRALKPELEFARSIMTELSAPRFVWDNIQKAEGQCRCIFQTQFITVSRHRALAACVSELEASLGPEIFAKYPNEKAKDFKTGMTKLREARLRNRNIERCGEDIAGNTSINVWV